jgi:hypothetical protein
MLLRVWSLLTNLDFVSLILICWQFATYHLPPVSPSRLTGTLFGSLITSQGSIPFDESARRVGKDSGIGAMSISIACKPERGYLFSNYYSPKARRGRYFCLTKRPWKANNNVPQLSNDPDLEEPPRMLELNSRCIAARA